MSTGILWIILSVLILLICILILFIYRVVTAKNFVTSSQPIDASNIQTGDIIIIGYNNFFGFVLTALLNTTWAHTGLAWRCPVTNELFIFEQANYGKKYKGVIRIPFDLWIRINGKHDICHMKLRGPPIDPYIMNEVCQEMEKAPRPHTIYMDRFLFHRKYYDMPLNHWFACYEINVMMLQKIGVVQKKFTCTSYTPYEILQGKLLLEHGYSYDDPIALRYKKIPQ